MKLFQVLGLALLCSVVYGVEESFGPMHVKLSPTGGKLEVSRAAPNGTEAEPRVVSFELVSIEEKKNDSSNSAIASHAFSAFSTNTFTITGPVQGSLTGSHEKAQIMTMSTQFTVGGTASTLTIKVYIFKNDDTITLGDETHQVKEDDVKFSVELSGWNWCAAAADCGGDIGEFLDVSMEVKSPEDPQEHGGAGEDKSLEEEEKKSGEEKEPDRDEGGHKKAPKWNLGRGAEMLLSRMIKLGGDNWQDMPKPYPKVEKVGSKNIVVVRVPTFSGSILYDPTIIIKPDDGSGVTGGSTMISISLSLLLATVWAALRSC